MAAEQIFAKLSQLEAFGRKVLSLLNTQKLRIDTLERTGGQPNVIEKIRVNGNQLAVDRNKAVDVTVPTATGQLTNNTDFQNGEQVDAAIAEKTKAKVEVICGGSEPKQTSVLWIDENWSARSGPVTMTLEIKDPEGGEEVEVEGLITHIDENGNKNLIYPVTKAELVDGLDENISAQVGQHTHDDRYYKKTEIDTKLSGLPVAGHTHDDRYYTEAEMDTKLAGKANASHTHNYASSSSAGGAANSANKLNTNAGSATQPVFFQNGVPVATTYTLGKSVPADAKFTDTNTTYSNFKAATSSAAGGSGLVPAPAAGKQGQFLRGDGTWQTPTNTTYGAATQSANGLMTAADKKKLDGIATGANAYSLPTASGSTLGGVKTGSNITNSSGTISVSKANVTSALGYTPANSSHTHNYAGSSSAGGTANSVNGYTFGAQTSDPGAGSSLTSGRILIVYV